MPGKRGIAATTTLVARPESQIRRSRLATKMPCRGWAALGNNVDSVSRRTRLAGRAMTRSALMAALAGRRSPAQAFDGARPRPGIGQAREIDEGVARLHHAAQP